jgi:hypothetical protein
MIPGPHFSAGRAMLAPVHYDDQVPSPPSLLKVRRQSVRLSDQPVLFWSDWGKSSSREIGRIFERFLHFLGQADRAGNPLGRLASEVLGLSNARVTPAWVKSCQVIRAIRRAVARIAMLGFLPSTRLRL